MICVDTSFLIHLWRERGRTDLPATTFVERHQSEKFAVSALVAGEFLEGGASISEERLAESRDFIGRFLFLKIDDETALIYARLVAGLRASGEDRGRSKADLWIAAAAVRHHCPIVTRNIKHFEDIPGLEVLRF